jgi:threonine aldolase
MANILTAFRYACQKAWARRLARFYWPIRQPLNMPAVSVRYLGGGMRQAGFLAAAGIYALDHHVERLKIDHTHARILGEELIKCPWVTNVVPVETNIVLFDTTEPADAILAKLEAKGIKAGSTDTHRIRFVTHLDVHPEQVEYVVDVMKSL